MEDASGVDLDWFWQGWFYTNDHVDQAITEVNHFQMNSGDPEIEKTRQRDQRDNGPQNISSLRAKDIKMTYDEIDTTLKDFYTTYDPLDIDAIDQDQYSTFVNALSPREKELLESGMHYYEITFKKKGGLVMPLIVQFQYADGTSEDIRIPAEVWRLGGDEITKVFPTEQEVTQILLDPYLETADTDTSDNAFPRQRQPSRFETFKQKQMMRNNPRENAMQRARRAEKLKKQTKP